MRRRPALSVFLAAELPAAAPSAQLRSQVVATGLQPGRVRRGSGRPLDVLCGRTARHHPHVRNNTVSPSLFLDLRSSIARRRRARPAGLAFASRRGESRRFYVNFTNPTATRWSRAYAPRRRARSIPSRFDLQWPDGRRFIEQPFSNHNGGHLAFGPRRLSLHRHGRRRSGGDPDAPRAEPQHAARQDAAHRRQRADDDPRGYRVPGGQSVRRSPADRRAAEIWAFGLRNPWRYSFDDWTRGGTGALVIADVGQNAREEMNCEPAARAAATTAGAFAKGARLRHATGRRVSAAHRADSRLPAQRRHVDHRRLRVSRRGARPDVQRALFLRRLRRGPRV